MPIKKKVKRGIAFLLALLLIFQIVYTDGKIIVTAETENSEGTGNGENSVTEPDTYTISGVVKEMTAGEEGSPKLQAVEGVTVTIVTDDTSEPITEQSCTTGVDGRYSIDVTFKENQTSMSWTAEKIGYATAAGTLVKGDTTLDTTEDTETNAKYLCMTAYAKKNLKITATTGENKLQLEDATITLKGYNQGEGTTQTTVKVSENDISTTFQDLYVNGDYTVTVEKKGYIAVTQTITQEDMEADTEGDVEVEVPMKAFGFENVTTDNSPFSISWKDRFENTVSSVEGVVNPTYSIIACAEDADETNVSVALDKYAEIDNTGTVTVKDLTQVSDVKLPVVLTIQAENGTERAETASYQLKITKAEQQVTWSSKGIAEGELYYGVEASVTAASVGSGDITYAVLEGADYIETASDGTISYKQEVPIGTGIQVIIKASRAADDLYDVADTDITENNYTFTLKRREVTEVNVEGSHYENGTLSENPTKFDSRYYYDTAASNWKIEYTGWFVGNTITIRKENCKISEVLGEREEWKDSISLEKSDYIGKSFYVKMPDGSISQKIEMSAMNWDKDAPSDLNIMYKSVASTMMEFVHYHYYNGKNDKTDKDDIAIGKVTISAKDTGSGIDYFEWGYVETGSENGAAPKQYEKVTNNIETTKDGVSSYSFLVKQEDFVHIDFNAYDVAGNRSNKQDLENAVIFDQTIPVIAVKYDKENKGSEAAPLYAEETTATIEVTEKNFSAAGVTVEIEAIGYSKDYNDEADNAIVYIEGEEIPISDVTQAVQNADWSLGENDLHTLKLTFPADARYTLKVRTVDWAENESEAYEKSFSIDAKAPSEPVVTYEDCVKEINNAGIVEKYYNDKISVDFQVADAESGIAYLEWKCIGWKDTESETSETAYRRIEATDMKDGKATVTIGTDEVAKCGEHMYVEVIAYDKAGNSTTYTGKASESGTKLILDMDAPVVKVTYDNNLAQNGNYYKQDRVTTIEITDTHFYKENVDLVVKALDKNENELTDIQVSLNNEQISLAALTEAVKEKEWEKKEGTNTYYITIKYDADAYYDIILDVKDFVDNEARQDTDAFCVDKTKPSNLNITYSTWDGEKTIDGITSKYYQQAMNVTFTAEDKESDIDVVKYKLTGENDYKELKNFTISGNVATGSIEIADSMQVEFMVMDKAGNTASYKDNIRIVIDETNPVVSVDYAEDTAVNGNYYASDRTATITVTEKNFDAEKVTVKVEAKDINGNAIEDATVVLGDETVLVSQLTEAVRKAGWKKSGNAYSLTLTFTKDAYYNVNVSAKDLAERSSNTVKNAFWIDQTRPSGLKIEYSTPVLEKILEKITFGYYKSSATITFTATDITSGIHSLSWKYQRAKDASNTNLGKEEGTVSEADITYSKDKKTATVKVKLTAKEAAQYRGNMSFTVVDKAGNSKSYKDSGEEIVIDNISPTMKVSYTPVNETSSKAYFNKKAVLNFEITEVNFEPEEIDLRINNEKAQCKNWKQVEGTDTWTGSITLKKDGDYKVTVAYKDRSSNKMKTYTSKTLVVDTQSPVIKVTYDKNNPVDTKNNIAFFDTTRKATISITDKNFRAEDVETVVTATWVDGSAIEVTDYNSYLKQASNWKQNGDVHTAVISYNVDANYTFDISYTDMATNSAVDYKTESFTVDTTAPENLQISYSQSVLETILENISFGFYDAKMTVTLTAEDRVAGVDHFSYSYKKAEAVSGVNNELIDQTIDTSQITYTNGNRTATAQFEVPKSELDANNQFNGTVEFMAADHSENKNQTADYRRVVVDNIAPTAEVTYNSPTSSANGIDYYAEAVEGQITITEANFQASDVEVSATKDGAPYALSVAWSDASADVHNGTFQISEDGDYMITIQYQDKSGNTMASYESNQLTVDSTTPTITVEEIANGTAYNKETIGLRVYVDDVNLDISSFQPVLTAIVREEDGSFAVKDYSELGNITAVEEGKSYAYVIENITEDAIYTLSCAAADLSSNEMSEMTVAEGGSEVMESVMFSVNRNGSTFMLDTATQEVVGNYYVQMVEENVVLKEINCDPVTEHQVTVNGEALQENADYQVIDNRGENTWYQYDYSINKEMFEEEGNYAVVVASTDKAENVAYSDMKNVEAAFVVDRTAPVVTVSGLAKNGRYQVETQKVSVIPTDDGGKLQSLEVNIYDRDDNLIENAVAMEGDELLENLESNSGKVVFEIPQGVNQKISIACTDAAGNAVPIEDSTYDNVTVSTEWYIMLLANKALLYGCAAGAVAIGGGAGVGIHFIRRRKSK